MNCWATICVGLASFALHDLKLAHESSSRAIEYLAQLAHLHSPQISVAEIYYQHSQILAAMGQADSANGYLQQAYDEMMRKANFIVEDQSYNDFLSKIELNQRHFGRYDLGFSKL